MAGALRRAGAAFQFRQYRLFWTGAVISNIGTWMQNVTVPYVLFRLTHSGTWVGLAVVAQILPSILVNPLSGSLADRFDRRHLLRLSNSVAAVAAFGLAALWASGAKSPTAILALVALGGTASMTTQPAWQAFVTDLVPEEHLLNAVTLNSAQANTARAVGPAIGGLILGAFGPMWAFLFNGVSFVAVLVVLTILDPPTRSLPAPEGKVLQQYREAIRYARGETGLLTAYASTALVCGLGYPVFQLAALFAERVYVVGPGKYGLLPAAYGSGAVLGAVGLGVFGAPRHRGQVLRAVLLVLALGLVGVGLSRSFWTGMPMFALVGAGSLCAIATLNTSIQTGAPPQLKGRLLALWVLSYTVSYPAGSLAQGALANRFGAGPVVTTAGLLLFAATAVLFLRPHLVQALEVAADGEVVDPVPATG